MLPIYGIAHDAAMSTFKVSLFFFLLLASSAVAQDIVMPVVPVVGVSPTLQWVMGAASIVVTTLFSLLTLFLKQRMDVANTADHSVMIDRAVKHGALLAYGQQVAGMSHAQAAANGLAYVKNAVPVPIDKNQTTDSHLSGAIAAEVVGLSTAAATSAPLKASVMNTPPFLRGTVSPAPVTKGP
jgi:hypothetical protein